MEGMVVTWTSSHNRVSPNAGQTSNKNTVSMKKQNIGKIAGLMAAAVIWMGASTSANATLTFGQPMWYSGPNSANIVGTITGQLQNSNPTTEAVIAQALLDMAMNTTSGAYRTTTTEYSGTIGA